MSTPHDTYTTAQLESFARRCGLDWGIVHDPDNRSPYYVVSVEGEPLVHAFGLGGTRQDAEEAILDAAKETDR